MATEDGATHEPARRAARLVVDGVEVGPAEVARTLADRSRGLLGRAGIVGALWLEPGSSVHTVRMRFPIDVAFVDRHGTVLRTVAMAPNRLSRVHVRARAVVEAERGRFDVWGLRKGSSVAITW